MSSVIRWLHLSDFHVGKDGYEQHRLFSEIVKEVARWRNELTFDPNYVFITGDIANYGLKKEYETFRRDFLHPLQETLGSSTKIIPVPGNHDVVRPTSDALNREAPLEAGSKFFDASKEGKSARDQVTPRFTHYKKQMSADVSPDWLASNEGVAIDKQDIDGIRVGVIGLNTAWLSKDEHDKDKLTPGYRLVEEALKQVDDCAIKIVLGHHPLSWWNEREERHIRTLFARSHVIYLHGHLHRSEGRVEEGGSENFLVLQTGAAFQARDDEQWENGFSWGEIDIAKAEVLVSPRYWDSINHEWPPRMGAITQERRVDGKDWWRYQLPGHAPAVVEPHSAGIPGWQKLTAEILNTFAREVTAEDAQRFFDGAEPEWAWAMTSRFPVRAQTQPLLSAVADFRGCERPQFALVHGPTAEGKSMALRQIVAAAAQKNPTLRVLWHLDETSGIDADVFERKLAPGTRWLIASDHGDMIAKGLQELAQRLRRAGRSDVQFVVAAHDSDWGVAKGGAIPWSNFTHFHEATLGGLPEADALAIARAWLDFGIALPDGIPSGISAEELAGRLRQAAQAEGVKNEGALFGALLTLRHGADLLDHVRTLLHRLDAMPLSGGGSVGLAFRYIAAMHGEDLDFLSRRVLRKALSVKDDRTLYLEVLTPLATEAAGSGGTQLRTRHRRIARAVLNLVQKESGNADELYVALVVSAIRLCRLNEEWLDGISNWESTLATYFLERERGDLAERIAERILELVPDNSYYVVKLAQIRRERRNISGALAALSGFTGKTHNGFWLEWGIASGLNGDYFANAWLCSYSVSDELGSGVPPAVHAKLAMSGLAKAFAELHERFAKQEFLDACSASVTMGLIVSNDGFNRGILEDHEKKLKDASVPKPKDMNEAIANLSKGLAAVLECGGMQAQLMQRIGDPSRYKFTGLLRRLVN